MIVWVPWLHHNHRILVLIRHLVAAAAHQSVILLNLLCLKIIFIKMSILIVCSMKFLLLHPFFLAKGIQIPYSSVQHTRIYLYLIQVRIKVLFLHIVMKTAFYSMFFYQYFVMIGISISIIKQIQIVFAFKKSSSSTDNSEWRMNGFLIKIWKKYPDHKSNLALFLMLCICQYYKKF